MIVVGSANGEREQHKFNVKSRHVDPITSLCGKVRLSDKRAIVGNRSLRKCRTCFGDVADQVGSNREPKRGGRHRK